ncbi:hypothetical protein ACH4Y0_08115 [Streptomyces sp. NPDC020707]|uniref:hypothetical protein n=1 Tax=Streptomyces sp. NPDC020707 TaxID=3365084 RepID=UPI0037B194E5
MPMSVLFIGGGVFIGRHLVEEAVRRGHQVTVMRRGLSSSAQSLEGTTTEWRDRSEGFGELTAQRWDLVIDTCGYVPSQVQHSAAELNCGTYVLISSISVYRDFSEPTPVDAPTVAPAMDGPLDGTSYGGLKAGCERALAEARPKGTNLIVRSGLVVGPHDISSRGRYRGKEQASTHLHYDRFSGRFPYWPWRFSRGGVIAVPGAHQSPLQLLDVRDLAEWLFDILDLGGSGVLNAVGPQISWGDLIEACASLIGDSKDESRPRVCWIPEDLLVAADVPPYTGLPIWAPETAETRWLHRVPAGGFEAGQRSITETVQAVSDWLHHGSMDSRLLLGGYELSREREQEIIGRHLAASR